MKKILNIIFTLCISFPTFADTIKGTITGNHSPLSNATIVALNQQRQNFTPIASATTDNQGNFSLTIPKDTKYLQFSANNYITATQEYSGIPTYKINLASSTQNTTNTNPPTESANADQTNKATLKWQGGDESDDETVGKRNPGSEGRKCP